MYSKRVALIGRAALDADCINMAREVALAVARHGGFVLTGGLGPLSEGVSAALTSGKLAHRLLEILPHKENAQEQQWLRLETNLGYLRNYLLVASADFVVAIGGGAGTMSEIAMAWQLHKKICIVGPKRGWAHVASWWLDHRNVEKIVRSETANGVIEWIEGYRGLGDHDNQAIRVGKWFDEMALWEKESSVDEEDLRVKIPRIILQDYIKPGGIAVDVGGGAGIDTAMIARGGMKVYYVDLSSHLAEICKDRLRSDCTTASVTVIVGGWQDIVGKVSDGECNLIIAMGESLSFITRPDERRSFFAFLGRKVKKGGVVLLTADNLYGRVAAHLSNGEPERAAAVLGSQLDKEVASEFPVYCYAPSELRGLMELAGFGVVRTIAYPISSLVGPELNMEFGQIEALSSSGKNLLCVGIRK